MCLRPQRGAFSGVLHAQTVASKNRCFHSAKRLSADLTGRRFCALRRAKITEGERVAASCGTHYTASVHKPWQAQ